MSLVSNMEITSQHPWHELLLSPLTAEQTTQALSDTDEEWEWVESQMIKLGSLAHSTLNIEDLQQRIIVMLSQRSKDFRLVVHLLRTLQQGAQPDQLMLAVSLLISYVQNFWLAAWPLNPVFKRRFAQQIVKRFESASSNFTLKATKKQRDEMLDLLSQLALAWHDGEPTLAKEIDGLRNSYARLPERVVESVAATDEHPGVGSIVAPSAPVAVTPSLKLDNSDDKAWRQTLLKMADILCDQQPEMSIGFRLRRHAVWTSLTTLPAAQSDGRTPLAAVSADRTADYEARLSSADLSLWQQVEQSLTLAPFWLDGHALSAQVALRLGFENVAEAIRDELSAFLSRLPGLKTLLFNDLTPFLSPGTEAWLQQTSRTSGENGITEQDEIWQCYQQQGLEAALQMTDQLAQSEPRERFLNQFLGAQLLEKSGLTTMAYQQYSSLLQIGQQLQLSEWEPALLALLKEKKRQIKP